VAGLDVIIDRRWAFHSATLGAAINRANPTVQQFLQHNSAAELATSSTSRRRSSLMPTRPL